MQPELEIIIPVRNPDQRLARTVASLAAQTDRKFSVILSDNASGSGLNHLKEAQQQLAAVGIPARRIRAPGEMGRLEHWNWAHAMAEADWLKPLPMGSELRPAYVEALNQRIHRQPQAQSVRCDADVMTEWGPETVRAPFQETSLSAAGFMEYFPASIRWLAGSSNMAFRRVAWQAAGGYSVQLPGSSFLNLNVILALHHGLENIHESLVAVDLAGEVGLNENHGGRVNLWLELWLILRQARNYSLAAKLPWPKKWLLLKGMMAMGRW